MKPETSLMEHYIDRLEGVFERNLVTDKLKLVYNEINTNISSIERIALALYDKKCDTLKTYTYHSDTDNPLSNYQSKLSESESLQQIVKSGHSRVINDLAIFDDIKKRHTIEIKNLGFKSSYTYPICNQGVFYGFIFVNSRHTNAFTSSVLERISPLIHLIAAFTMMELNAIKLLTATVNTALEMTHHRDPETGQHLARMARYSRLIAKELADKYNISDELIEHIYLFAPLHDVGKIAIPDNILLKPDKLTPQEFEIMKTHTKKGVEIINNTLKNYHLENMLYTDVLRNIIEHHHEKIDGSGYPNGLLDRDIPIEAKIVCIADIFDALTSDRPYKDAWTNDKAFAELERLKDTELDVDGVNAILNNRVAIERIQLLFQDNVMSYVSEEL